MSGYIGSKTSVTLVDGYTQTEADAEFVQDPNGAITVSGSNVGIGTSSPSAPLHVSGGGTGSVIIDGTDSIRPSTDTSLITISGGNATNSGANYSMFGGSHASLADVHRWRTSGTERMRIDAAGIVTTPYQPAFNVRLSGTQSNIAVSTPVTILFNDEFFDQNHDFDTGTYTFTAPVTGKYKLEVMLRLNNVDASASYYYIYFHTSNRTYYSIVSSGGFASDAAYWTMNCPVLADMDASDTAVVKFHIPNNGAAQADIEQDTYFSGFLAC